MERRNTRSTSILHEGSDAQFWAAQPNPIQIERGHAEAVALARATTRTRAGVTAEGEIRGTEVSPTRGDVRPSETQGVTGDPTRDLQSSREGQLGHADENICDGGRHILLHR